MRTLQEKIELHCNREVVEDRSRSNGTALCSTGDDRPERAGKTDISKKVCVAHKLHQPSGCHLGWPSEMLRMNLDRLELAAGNQVKADSAPSAIRRSISIPIYIYDKQFR